MGKFLDGCREMRKGVKVVTETDIAQPPLILGAAAIFKRSNEASGRPDFLLQPLLNAHVPSITLLYERS